MGIFSRKSNDAFKKDMLAEILRGLKTASDAGNVQATYHRLFELSSGNHLDAPEVPFIVNGVIEAAARRNLDDGLGMVIYTLNTFQDDDLRDMITGKTLSLISRADRSNMKQMASVSMAANLLVSRNAAGTPAHLQGLKEWHAAVDILGSKKESLGFAFAAASNAALGNPAMKNAGVDKWEKVVENAARIDLRQTLEEISRVMMGYGSFGHDADAFRERALKMARSAPDLIRRSSAAPQ